MRQKIGVDCTYHLWKSFISFLIWSMIFVKKQRRRTGGAQKLEVHFKTHVILIPQPVLIKPYILLESGKRLHLCRENYITDLTHRRQSSVIGADLHSITCLYNGLWCRLHGASSCLDKWVLYPLPFKVGNTYLYQLFLLKLTLCPYRLLQRLEEHNDKQFTMSNPSIAQKDEGLNRNHTVNNFEKPTTYYVLSTGEEKLIKVPYCRPMQHPHQ